MNQTVVKIDKDLMGLGYQEMAEINLGLSHEGFNAEEEVSFKY